MRNHFLNLSVSALLAAPILSVALLAQTRQPSGTANGKAASSQKFDPHDISGIWSRNSNYWGGGGTCRECGDRGFGNDVPPMTPEGEARFNSNKPGYGRTLGSPAAAAHPEEHIGRRRAVPPALGNDPTGHCNPSGLTRILLYPDPVEFIQASGRVFQFFQWTRQWRDIWTDGRELTKEPDTPRWYGYSVGKWDGDTFVVDSNGFEERTWVDHFGYPHSDAMHLQERYRRIAYDTLQLDMTITDPKIYTRPWISQKKIFKLVPRNIMIYDGWYGLGDYTCVPEDEEHFNTTVRDRAGKKD